MLLAFLIAGCIQGAKTASVHNGSKAITQGNYKINIVSIKRTKKINTSMVYLRIKVESNSTNNKTSATASKSKGGVLPLFIVK